MAHLAPARKDGSMDVRLNRRLAHLAHACPERTLVTTGLSKSFSRGGYRRGVFAVPSEMAGLSESLETIASEESRPTPRSATIC